MSIDCVILDRDGVINEDSADYIKTPEEWHPIAGSLDAIARLSSVFPVYVATNQAGVGRGILTFSALMAINDKMESAVSAAGGLITDIAFCPHHPDDNCRCRKPAPGLLLDLARRHGFDPARAIFIGDSMRDIEAARAAGCQAGLVLTGHGEATLRENPALAHAEDLRAWADRLLG